MLFNSSAQEARTTVASADNELARKERTYFYTLGNRQIAIRMVKYGNNKDIVLINLHDDETTGIEAAKKVLERTGGILIRIDNNSQRYITFSKNRKTIRFDPNRMFTPAGVAATLFEQNKHSTDVAVRDVNGFARFCLNKIPAANILIALHNNDDSGLSVLSYLKGGHYEKAAAAVNQSDVHDPDNFFLTTDRQFFRLLRSAGYNVVLQHNKKAKDDGSLSIYYGRRNKRYINIEAEAGNVIQQQRMIEAVAGMINGL